MPLGRECERDIPAEHADILEAAVARDIPQAVDRLTEHIQRTTDILLTCQEATSAAGAEQTAAATPEQAKHP